MRRIAIEPAKAFTTASEFQGQQGVEEGDVFAIPASTRPTMSKKSLIEELKNTSDEMTRISNELAARREQEAATKQQAEAKAAREKADAALQKVPELTRKAAQQGFRSQTVYTHGSDEIGHDGVGIRSWPVGAAQMVVEGCQAMGFKTEWGYLGGTGGYGVIVSW